jgi:hypothetical protein
VLQIASCFLSVAAIAFATAAAGRLLGISLTAIASGLMAFFMMPPVFSLRVASSGDVLMLVAHGIAGLVVVHTVRTKRPHERSVEPPPVFTGTVEQRRPVLSEAISRAMDRDDGLRSRASDLHVYVDEHARPPVSTSDLDQVVVDILRIAFGQSNVQRVSVYSARQPEVERIRVVAEYELNPTLPRLRITARRDDQCMALPMPGWPRGCTATWFDNGTEFIYQVKFSRRTNPDDSSGVAAATQPLQ